MIREDVSGFLQNKNAIMFITTIIFMAGILSYFNNIAVQSAFILTIIAVIVLWKKYIPLKYILLWILIFYAGFFNAYFRVKTSDNLAGKAPADAVIEGRIVSIPNSSSAGKTKFFLQAASLNNEKISGKTLVTVSSDDNNFSEFNIGNLYKIEGKLRQPFEAGNPSQFDYGKYLRNFNTYSVFYAEKSGCSIIDEKLPLKWTFLQKLNNVRNRIINTHAKYLKSPNLEILGGIVFGDDAVAPPDYIKTTFTNSGLLHILAASGMNVAFIYGFWYFILRRLRAPFVLTVISGMGVVILYTLMTGLGPSVIRAALMLLFILAGKLIDRDAHSVALLALVGGLMLIYNPAYINDVGFQLSFLVTFGLLTTADVVMKKFEGSKLLNWFLGGIMIPVIAQIWVIPVQMFYFNTISTYSVLANIAIMPFLSVISFGGFVSSVIAVLPPLAKWTCLCADFILKYLLDILVAISNFFANLPHSVIETPHPSVFQVLLYYSVVMALTYLCQKGFHKKLIIFICAAAVILAASTVRLPQKTLDIIAFDVGNADAFLIKSPGNKYFVIDTGKAPYKSSSSQAKFIILKYLKDRGIKNIEGLIITHFDNDHSGGAVDILESRRVKKTYINTFANQSYTSYKIYKTLKEKHIKTEIPASNSVIYREKDFEIRTFRANLDNDNENSIITLVKYGSFEMLFTGDAGVKAFDEIKSGLPENIEVLKVGHHGAKNVVNDEMLTRLKPEVSVISTGLNYFGHPAKGTLDILRNTSIYRTDRNNSIKITSDGNEYKVLTYNRTNHKYEINKVFHSLTP